MQWDMKMNYSHSDLTLKSSDFHLKNANIWCGLRSSACSVCSAQLSPARPGSAPFFTGYDDLWCSSPMISEGIEPRLERNGSCLAARALFNTNFFIPRLPYCLASTAEPTVRLRLPT